MRVQCDGCEKAGASFFCCADEAALCGVCDSRVHDANKLASKHHRLCLLERDLPRCDICQEKRAFFFCQEDRAVLCRDCDVSIHSANALTAKHSRFLLSGIKVSLHPHRHMEEEPQISFDHQVEKKRKLNPLEEGDASVFSSTEPSKGSEQDSGAGGGVSQYLKQVEEFLASTSPQRPDASSKENDIGKFLDEDWIADLGFSWVDTLAEVPQTHSPPPATVFCRYGPMGITMRVKERQHQHSPVLPNFDDIFMVPDIGLGSTMSTKQMRSFWEI
eukprot:Gb_06624 [translate_table: standard]